MDKEQPKQMVAEITREQALSRILFNLGQLTDREVRMVDAFIQGIKKSQG